LIRLCLAPALAVLVAILCAGAVAAPKEEVEQVTTTLPTLNPGQTAWVSTLWRGASSDATSFELTAHEPKGITISYPENTGSYSSLYKSSTLLAADTDYASIKVHVADNVVGDERIKLTLNYELAGKKVNQKADVTLPVVAFTGPAVEQVTTSVGPVKAGSAAWVSVAYKANKPGVTDARLTAQVPAGASVTYPNEGTSTGFAADANLSVGETDSASFKIDTGTLAPGSHELQLDLSYGDGQSLPGTVALEVSE
jgi:hypothetical protein